MAIELLKRYQCGVKAVEAPLCHVENSRGSQWRLAARRLRWSGSSRTEVRNNWMLGKRPRDMVGDFRDPTSLHYGQASAEMDLAISSPCELHRWSISKWLNHSIAGS